MEKKETEDGYKKLSSKGKKLVEMYITARQFKNAILEEEMIILPAKQNNIKEGSIINWGGTKVTFRGDKSITRIYPFIVNKSFACEVYLKLILVELDFNFKTLKHYELHSILKLYENTDDIFKRVFVKTFNNKYGEQANKEFLEKEITNISDVFSKWRYIYEKINQENIVNSGFLNSFCDFLDRYVQKLILFKYKYDVDKNMR